MIKESIFNTMMIVPISVGIENMKGVKTKWITVMRLMISSFVF